MKQLLLAALLAASTASAQILPVQYNKFDGNLTATYGSNATTAGAYSFGTGAVGQAMVLTSAGRVVNIGSVNSQKVTVEFLYKPDYQFDNVNYASMVTIGNADMFNLGFNTNIIGVFTPGANNTGRKLIFLDGVGRFNYRYYNDTSTWKHIVITFDGTTGRKAIWVNGQNPSVLAFSCPTGTINGNIFLNDNNTYGNFRGRIDEVAIYKDVMADKQIFQDYLYTQQGLPYPFTLYAGVVPTPDPVTAPKNINDYPLGYTLGAGNANSVTYSFLQQLRMYPNPRYADTVYFQRNFNWTGVDYDADRGVTGSNTTNYNLSKAIQRELGRNWYYGIIGMQNNNANDPGWNGAFIDAANSNTSITLDGITNYAFQAQAVNAQNDPASYYIRNSSFAYLQPNGGIDTIKWLDIYRYSSVILDSIKRDGKRVATNLRNTWLPSLTNDFARISENDENVPLFTQSTLTNSPTTAAAQASSGLTWKNFIARGWTSPFLIYSDSVKSAVPGVQYLQYAVDGQESFRAAWSYTRVIQSSIRGFKYSTPDFYPRQPYNWRYWNSAWHGLDWIMRCRSTELAAGDSLYAPFVAAGWDINSEVDVRPAQWLGLLKNLTAYGTDFFHTAYFNLGAPFSTPKGWAWQLSIPSYVQAVNSNVQSLFMNSKILAGDVPIDYQAPSVMSYTYYAGDKRKIVNIRKVNNVNKYLIYASINGTSNMTGSVEDSSQAMITLAGQQVFFYTYRQGAVYLFDNTTPSDPVFYQLDKWHEAKSPDRWSSNLYVEAEVPQSGTPTIKTTGTASTYDFRAYTSYISTQDTVGYNTKVRAPATYYLYVYAKSNFANGSIKAIHKTDTVTLGCINSWGWYAYKGCGTLTSFALDTNSVVKLLPSDSSVYIDRFVLSTSSSLVTALPGCSNASTPTITASLYCTGDSALLTSSAASAYLWNGGTTTQTKVAYTSGTYTVTVTSGSCTASGTAAVTLYSVTTPTISGTTTSCTPVVWTTSTTYSSYAWSNGATTQAINLAASGTYTVTVTNGSCTASASKTLTISSTPTPAIAVTQYCADSALFDAGAGYSSYLWTAGTTTQTKKIYATGTYTVTVSNGTCTASTTQSVTISGSFVPVITGNLSPCFGTTTTLDAGAFTSYLWSTAATTQTISAGTGTYTVTVSNGTCTASASAVVAVLPAITNSITSTPSCSESIVVLESDPFDAYLWSTGTTTQTDTVVSGTYTVTVTSGACTASGTVSATVRYLNPSVSGAASFCSGGSTQWDAGAFTSATYLWSNSKTTRKVTLTSAGTYTVTVTNGTCTASATKSLTADAVSVTITASPNDTCTDCTINLDAGSHTTYLWSNGSTAQDIDFSTYGAATYTVTVTDGSCTGSASVRTLIIQGTPPAVTISPASDTIFCAGGSVVLTAEYNGTPDTYLWSTGSTDQDITASASGTYTVTVSGDIGSASGSIQVVNKPLPNAVVLPSSAYLCTSSTQPFTASGGVSYLWSNSSTMTTITVASGTYTCTVTSVNGCTKTVSCVAYSCDLCIPQSMIARNLTPFDPYYGSCGVYIGWTCNNPDLTGNFEIKITKQNGKIVYKYVPARQQYLYMTGITPDKVYKYQVRLITKYAIGEYGQEVSLKVVCE